MFVDQLNLQFGKEFATEVQYNYYKFTKVKRFNFNRAHTQSLHVYMAHTCF